MGTQITAEIRPPSGVAKGSVP